MSRRGIPSLRPSREEEGQPQWALSFADLMAQLLAFFILMASFSNMDVIKYRSLVGSLKDAFGTRDRIPDDAQFEASSSSGLATAESEEARIEVEEGLEALVQDAGGPLQIVHTPEGMRVRLEGQAVFDFGKSEIRLDALPLFSKLSPLFAKYPYRIWVEGHTDDVPIQNEVFPSNWELSGARAGRVVRELITKGQVPAQRLVAAGYAETRPVMPNDTEGGRQRNRRVEFLLSRPPSASSGASPSGAEGSIPGPPTAP